MIPPSNQKEKNKKNSPQLDNRTYKKKSEGYDISLVVGCGYGCVCFIEKGLLTCDEDKLIQILQTLPDPEYHESSQKSENRGKEDKDCGCISQEHTPFGRRGLGEGEFELKFWNMTNWATIPTTNLFLRTTQVTPHTLTPSLSLIQKKCQTNGNNGDLSC